MPWTRFPGIFEGFVHRKLLSTTTKCKEAAALDSCCADLITVLTHVPSEAAHESACRTVCGRDWP